MPPPRAKTKRFSPRRFAVGAMLCPNCRRRLENGPERCPSCGFTGADCLRLFPFAAPALEEVIDPDGMFDAPTRRAIKSRLDKLRRRYRQIHWCLCFVGLPPHVNLRLFGFWLLNSARPPAGDHEAPAWTVLVVVDTTHRAGSVTAGYAIEPFVSDDAWMRALSEMSRAWRRGEWGEAVCEFLTSCDQELESAGWRVMKTMAQGHHEGES